jgi:predicted GNAT family acetyltransferase
LDELVGMARENDLKIMPLCPYAKHQFDKDHSIHDVLKKD